LALFYPSNNIMESRLLSESDPRYNGIDPAVILINAYP
jgi:hypothetical protein